MTGSESVNPRTRLTELSWGYRVSQALYVAARPGVFDVAAKGPKTADEIASIVGANEGAFDRLLSALTSVGVLYEDEEGRFHNSELGALLQADHPQSMQAVALMQGEPARWAAWGDLFETIRTGEPAFERIHGEPMFDYLQGAPGGGAGFQYRHGPDHGRTPTQHP